MKIRSALFICAAILLAGVFLAGAQQASEPAGCCPRAACERPCPEWRISDGVFGGVDPQILAETKFMDRANGPRGCGWIRLSNGENMEGWVSVHPDKPCSWKVVDGVMINEGSHDHRGVNIFTARKWDDFEIYYEYRIPEGSNSGLYLRGRYEIQIFDSFKEQKRDFTVNGGIWNCAVPYADVDRAPMEWQSVYAKIVDRKVTVVLNGTLIHDEFKVPFPTGGHLDTNESLPGPVMIQGDHGAVEVRQIYLRPLDGPVCR